jgi:hypothetical protein
MSDSADRELVDLRTRTKWFALRVIRVFTALPHLLADLRGECDQLIAILTPCVKKVKGRQD